MSLPRVLPAAARFSRFHFAGRSFCPCFSRAGRCSSACGCPSSEILSRSAVLTGFQPKGDKLLVHEERKRRQTQRPGSLATHGLHWGCHPLVLHQHV